MISNQCDTHHNLVIPLANQFTDCHRDQVFDCHRLDEVNEIRKIKTDYRQFSKSKNFTKKKSTLLKFSPHLNTQDQVNSGRFKALCKTM